MGLLKSWINIREYAFAILAVSIFMGIAAMAEAGDLTRESALALIQKGGKEAYEIDVPAGDSVNMEVMFSTLKHMDRSRADQINAAYKCLNRHALSGHTQEST